MNTADITMSVLAIATVAVVGIGAFVGSRRSGSDVLAAKRVAGGAVLALLVWLGFAALLAESGMLSDWATLPPRWPLLPFSAFIAIALVTRSAAANRILSKVPAAWLIATQTFRVGVELGLYALHTEGRAPIQITFEGRNFDIVVGLSAPLVAWLLATRRIGARAAVLWNVAGLAVLANTVGTVATSTPGPLHHDWPGLPFTAIVSWPIVWLPAYLMPLAVFLHVASLQQNLRLLRSVGVT